ncbi:MAG: ferritin family protein, partial [bacterium]
CEKRPQTNFRQGLVIEGDLVSLLEADAAAEDETIKRYLYHKTLTDDEELLSLLDRIIADERSHYKEFLDMIEELSTEAAEAETDSTEEEDTSDEESPPGLTPAQAALLQESLEDEYTSVLQYLYRYFTSRDGDEFEDYAIDEMKHMGWFAEALADSNIQPKLTHVAREIDNHEQALKIELSREEETIEKYSGARAKFADEEIKDLFELALSHEKYHADGLKREIVKQEKRSGKRFTIGSLRRK